MKIRQYIKRMATLALMVATLALPTGAWGQVKGDRYETISEAISDDFFTVKLEDEDDQDIRKAFDGNYDVTWWEANSAGEKTIVISFNEPTYIHSIYLMGGGADNQTSASMRPESVKVEGKTADEEDWEEVQTFGNILRDTRHATLTLDADKRKGYETLKLTLIPGKNDQGHKLVMNEITLRSDVKVSIKHKPAKWHDLRSSLNISQAAKDMDTFNDMILWDQIKFPGMENYQVQSAHTLIDTIYVHKGSSVRLNLPDRLNESTNMNSYQRWYSFRTDKTFEVNNADY